MRIRTCAGAILGIAALISAMLASPAGAIDTEPTRVWEVEVPLGDEEYDVAAVGADVVAVGAESDAMNMVPATIKRYDADGDLEWLGKLGGGIEGFKAFYGVATGSDERIYAVGTTRAAVAGTYGGGNDALVHAVAGNGTVRWTDQFGTAEDEILTEVVVGADGSVYAIGTAFGAGGGGARDIVVRKYTANGAVVWTKEFGTSLNDLAEDAAVLSDGSILIVGAAREGTVSFDTRGSGLILRIDTAGNELLLTTPFTSGVSNMLTGVAALPDGGYMVGGWQYFATSNNGLLYRYAADNSETYGRTPGDNLFDLERATDGTIVATAIPAEAAFEEGVLVGYDVSNGAELWSVGLNSSTGARVTATSDGELFVAYSNVLSAPGAVVRFAASSGGGGGGGGGTGFTDVPAGAFYTDAVAWLKNEGITTGTSPTTYSPDGLVTRGQMAAFLWRMVGEPGNNPAHGFSDVPEGTFYAEAVRWLKEEAITTGTTPSTYSPDDNVTRAQMAAFLHRLAGAPDGNPAHGFSDVPDSSFYAEAVRWLKDQGITTGTSATTYSPNDNVTRGQMAAFLFRMATDSDWDYPGD
ncbi:MAG: S-layer homology domain-containing protein [Acidimicrobiales bacterium]